MHGDEPRRTRWVANCIKSIGVSNRKKLWAQGRVERLEGEFFEVYAVDKPFTVEERSPLPVALRRVPEPCPEVCCFRGD